MSNLSKPVCRSYEKQFEVKAPLDSVWKAITEGEELTRWFCEAATTEPGPGGKQTVDWGGGAVGTSTITVWEPGRHLRTEAIRPDMVNPNMPAPAEPYAVDWYLEHANGITRVRMVASGFGEGPAWDHEYDGTYHGWDLFHRNMKHYLENHRGKPAGNVVLYAVLPGPIEAAWNRLFGPEGLVKEGSLDGLQPGSRFRFRTATGDQLDGIVRKIVPPKTFSALVESLNNGLLNVEMATMGNAHFLYLTVLTWGLPKHDIDALNNGLRGLVYRLFPQPDKMPPVGCAAGAAT
jgi:uncharacterized protein YndB with AHSA1/START domain